MNRNLLMAVASAVLIVAAAILFVRVSAASDAASSEIESLKATVNQLRMTLDSVRAQTPGLGEYMSRIQLHTGKLWIAAQASNWRLAEYELHELEETFEAAEVLHLMKNNVDITTVLQSVRQTQLLLVKQSIANRSLGAFSSAYHQTLDACNGCHRPTGYEFIHIVTPTAPPVTNQQWKVDVQ